MTDDWTPSTEQVRSHYVFNQSDQWEAERGEAFDRWLAAHDAQKRAEWEAERGARWYTGAYRARNGNAIPIGVENTMRGEAERTVEEFRREDPEGPDYFVATRVVPPWLPVDENGESK